MSPARDRDSTGLHGQAKAGRLAAEVDRRLPANWAAWAYVDNPVARPIVDVRLVSIGAARNEIMLGIICKLMGRLPRKRPAKIQR